MINPNTLDGLPATATWVIARLEEAGIALLALPNSGPSTRLAQGGMEWVHSAAEAYGAAERRRQLPDAARHDEAPPAAGDRAELVAVPHHLWANRGPSVMRVFVPLAGS